MYVRKWWRKDRKKNDGCKEEKQNGENTEKEGLKDGGADGWK